MLANLRASSSGLMSTSMRSICNANIAPRPTTTTLIVAATSVALAVQPDQRSL